MSTLRGTLPSGTSFSLDLRLNHPTLLPGVQVMTEETILSGGKLFRPRLCFMFAEAIGLQLESVNGYARIAELIHGATLAHDDVIDQATERRKKPTLNDKMTQARAILAGDLMLSRATVELCELGHPVILKRMSEVLEDLVTGEWLQLENHGSLVVTSLSLETIARYKTAAMIEWCVQVPFYVAHSNAKTIELARRFGKSVGLAFQYMDDCVDFYAESGKAFAHDLSEGLLNQVTLTLLERNPKLSAYFKKSMQDGRDLDPHAFAAEVGSQDLNSAIELIQNKASFQVSIADQTLNEIESNFKDSCDFIHIRDAIHSIVNRRQ